MQGRLSKQTQYGYQAFPRETWEQEFFLAESHGLDHIEWVVDTATLEANTILNDPSRIGEVTAETGVEVVSVCADFLMDVDFELSGPNLNSLRLVSRSMVDLGAQLMVVPCVDQSSLRNKRALERFQNMAIALKTVSDEFGIQLSLETDLPPSEFAVLLKNLSQDHFGVNYDIGNIASFGYDPKLEVAKYGKRMTLVHIKDRVLGGGSVILGGGDAGVVDTISLVSKSGYRGPYTMQAFRDESGAEVFVEQLGWLKDNLAAKGA